MTFTPPVVVSLIIWDKPIQVEETASILVTETRTFLHPYWPSVAVFVSVRFLLMYLSHRAQGQPRGGFVAALAYMIGRRCTTTSPSTTANPFTVGALFYICLIRGLCPGNALPFLYYPFG